MQDSPGKRFLTIPTAISTLSSFTQSSEYVLMRTRGFFRSEFLHAVFPVPAYRIAPGPDSHPRDSAWTPLHRARRVLRQPLERVLEDHGDWNSRSASGLRGT